MSGPKGASYRVVSKAELERRRRAQEVTRLTAELTTVRTEIAQQRAVISDVRADELLGKAPDLTLADDPGRLRRKVAAARGYLLELQRVAQRGRVDAVRTSLTHSFPALRLEITSPHTASPTVTSGAEPSVQDPGEESRARLVRVMEHVAGLDDVARDRLMPAISAAETAGAAGPRAFSKAVQVLEVQVTAALRERQSRTLLETKRRQLETDFADVVAAHPAFASRVATASTSHELDHVAADLAAARAEIARAQDRAYVLAQAEAALTDLGYQVDLVRDPEHGVDRLTGRSTEFRSHAVQLLFPPGAASFHTRAVAFGTTDPRDDLTFEQTSCADLDRLMADLDRRGVAVEVTRRTPPGAVPLLHVAPPAEPATSTRATRANAPRTRTLGS